MLSKELEQAYISILQEELVCATGCTEPIALAFASARMKELLGEVPYEVIAEVSGNIIKNVKSVVVPNTGGLKGIEAAIAAGVIAGDANQGLQVIGNISKDAQPAIKAYVKDTSIHVFCADTPHLLDIKVTGTSEHHQATVRIANNHSNVILEEVDGTKLVEIAPSASSEDNLTDKSCLTIKDILSFVNTVPVDAIEPMVGRQIDYNIRIAKEGLVGDWGANIGSVILSEVQNEIKIVMKAWGAAGSDARMSGCELPVVILSGSGNQGITASVPVVKLCEKLGVDREKTIRAVALSDLVAIEQKRGIGRLSAYCGAVSAGVGVGAAMAYLLDGSYRAIAHTIVNAVAIISGTICDGAKPSCAAKIAESIDAGVLGYHMWEMHQQFREGDGIVTKGVEETIANIGILAQEGMQQTDKTILGIMTEASEKPTVGFSEKRKG